MQSTGGAYDDFRHVDSYIAGYLPVSDFPLVFKAWLGVFAEFLGFFYMDHVRFDLRHPCLLTF